jgi:hypothetical protein
MSNLPNIVAKMRHKRQAEEYIPIARLTVIGIRRFRIFQLESVMIIRNIDLSK